jgi:hypothetical protein
MSYRIKSLSELPAAIRKSLSGERVYGSLWDAAMTLHLSAAKVDEPKRQKFGNVACIVHGHKFPSKWEGQRYEELLMMERQGIIRDLSLQYPFGLEVQTPAGAMVRIGAYIADFVYWRGERMFIEDAKSAATKKLEFYKWKKAHCEQQYGVHIIDVERNKPRSGAAA